MALLERSPSQSKSSPGSQYGGDSTIGAEMLFNEDYLKKYGHNGNLFGDESDTSNPLSRHSRRSLKSDKSRDSDDRSKLSRHSRHSRHSGHSRHSRHSKHSDSGRSSSPSAILREFEKRKKAKTMDDSSSLSSSAMTKSIKSSSSASSASSASSSSSMSSIIVPKKKRMSHEDILKKKQELLFELDRFEAKGRSYFRKLTLASSLEEIEGAFERLQLDSELDDAIVSLREALILVLGIVENLSQSRIVQTYSPIKPRLKGWSQSISMSIHKFDSVFKKLYVKHRSRASFAPEVELLGLIVMSGASFHICSLASNSVSGLNDVLQKDPTLFPKFMSFINESTMPNGASGNMGNMGNMGTPTNSGNSGNPGNMGSAGSAGNKGGGPDGTSISSLINWGMGLLGGALGGGGNNAQGNKNNAPPMPMPMQMPMPMPTPSQNQRENLPPSSVPMPMPMPVPQRDQRDQRAQQPQMRGPQNMEEILRLVEDDRLDTMSNASDTGLSDIPDDVSISGLVSNKKQPRRIVKNQ